MNYTSFLQLQETGTSKGCDNLFTISDTVHESVFPKYGDSQPRPQGPLLSCAGNRDPWPIGFQGQFLLAVERQRHNRKLK